MALGLAHFGDVLDELSQELLGDLGVRDLAAAEEDGAFDFVALFEEAQRMVLLELVVVVVRVGTELDLFDLDAVLLLLGLVLLLLLEVGVLAVVDDLGDGGLRGRRDENEVET